jgi:hypothetical protein
MKFTEEVSSLDWQGNDEPEDDCETQPGDPGETIVILTISTTHSSSLWEVAMPLPSHLAVQMGKSCRPPSLFDATVLTWPKEEFRCEEALFRYSVGK